MSLCGFLRKEDRDIFNILQSVSGVGMKMALTLLDEFSGFDLISAVIKEDSKLIATAKGIGPKLAQKIKAFRNDIVHAKAPGLLKYLRARIKASCEIYGNYVI